MGTRSVLAVQQGDGWKGRYCHWDGYPDHQLTTLLELIERDGAERVRRVLTEEHYGWSTTGADQGNSHDYQDDPRFVAVPGYGVAYTTEQGQSSLDDWITHDGDDWGTEWAYVIGDRSVTVFERVYDDGDHAIGAFGMNTGGNGWKLHQIARYGYVGRQP